MRTRYTKRIDRANRTRSALARKSRGRLRLSVFRSSKHIYAQVIDDVRGVTLAAASTVDTALKGKLSKTTDIAAAAILINVYLFFHSCNALLLKNSSYKDNNIRIAKS